MKGRPALSWVDPGSPHERQDIPEYHGQKESRAAFREQVTAFSQGIQNKNTLGLAKNPAGS